MARPRKFDPYAVRQKIMNIFWSNGYEGTSLSDLTKGTGLKKGSLYGAFGDKSSMFQLALLEYDHQAIEKAIAYMDSLPGYDALAALMFGTADAVEQGDRRGCLLCNSLSEYGKLDEVARALAERGMASMSSAVARALTRHYGEGDHKAKALEMLAVYIGLGIMARAGLSAVNIKAAGQAALDTLKV